jgi:hypothetical protein
MFIQERLNEFYDKSMDSEYREHWTQKAIELIADAYAIGVNEKWVVARLENCDYQAIHKTIINKCRDKLDFWTTQEHDKKVINAMLERHKKELYGILTSDIYNYCIR